MEIRARDNERELLLELSGEIDHHGARNALKEVEMAIDAALPRLLTLDFSGVTFMDSSGIALILPAADAAAGWQRGDPEHTGTGQTGSGRRRDRAAGFHQVNRRFT